MTSTLFHKFNFFAKVFFLSCSKHRKSEMVPKNPRAHQLWEKWRHVWTMAWDRQRRLREKLAHLMELERIKNFSWDDWRRRVLFSKLHFTLV